LLVAGIDVYCEKITEQDLRDSCFRKVGLVTGIADTCGKIGENQDYRDECYKYSAEKNSEQETCALVLDSVMRDACYLKVADLLNDNSFCDKVSTRLTEEGHNRDLCILAAANVTGDQCAQMLGEVDRAACFARATNIPNLEVNCDAFSDSNSIANCKKWVVKYSGDVSTCYELDSAETATCISGAVDGNVTLTMCQTITGFYIDTRNTCYKKLALQENDESYCDNVSGSSQIRLACQTDVAVAKLDKTICPTRTDARDDCISKIALATKNFSTCESISTDRSYINCFTDIAIDLDSSEICARAERTNLRLLPYTGADYCYNDYAISIKDANPCRKINFSSLRNNCLEIIETCIDEDSVCNEAVCSYSNDTDCLKPGQCTTTIECEDGKFSTINTCVNNICKSTLITSCTAGDHYCPSNCTYVGNPEAENNTDADCLQPCTLAGGEICAEGTVCPGSNTVPSLDVQCCELHEEEGQTYCEIEE